MPLSRKLLFSVILLAAAASASDPALPPRPQLDPALREQATALRNALPASARPKFQQAVAATVADLDRDGRLDVVAAARAHVARHWGDPHVQELMVTLVLFEASAHQEKVVEKATSGLKDTLKTQVRTAAPQTQSAAPAGTAVTKETAGRQRPFAPVPPVRDPHAAKTTPMNMQFLALQEANQRLDRMYTTISNVLKTRHDTAKNAIGNIR